MAWMRVAAVPLGILIGLLTVALAQSFTSGDWRVDSVACLAAPYLAWLLYTSERSEYLKRKQLGFPQRKVDRAFGMTICQLAVVVTGLYLCAVALIQNIEFALRGAPLLIGPLLGVARDRDYRAPLCCGASVLCLVAGLLAWCING